MKTRAALRNLRPSQPIDEVYCTEIALSSKGDLERYGKIDKHNYRCWVPYMACRNSLIRWTMAVAGVCRSSDNRWNYRRSHMGGSLPA